MEVGANSPSDGNTINKEDMRSGRRDLTSIHLVYVRIPDEEITVIFTSIHWVYVRVPSKGSPYADTNEMMMIPMKTVLVMRWVK